MSTEKTLLTLLTLGVLIPAILWLAYAIPSIIHHARKQHGQNH